jgi:hypothetical protein
MSEVFTQYKQLLDQRAAKVRQSSGRNPDMRTGWLLWQESLREFLYFEEPTRPPRPEDHYAVWNENRSRGARIGSKNLWIYERVSGKKRFSVTTEAGAKLQPYFDVPPVGTEHLYIFVVQGEATPEGLVRVWVSKPTERDLLEAAGDLSPAALSDAIERAQPPEGTEGTQREEAVVSNLLLRADSYSLLCEKFDAISDEQRMRLLVAALRVPR